jgi:hypothetical protein
LQQRFIFLIEYKFYKLIKYKGEGTDLHIKNLFTMDKYREFYNAIPPKQITSCDSFQVLNYYLIIEIFQKPLIPISLPGQNYDIKHKYIREFLNTKEDFIHCNFFCPLYFITVVPEDELNEFKSGYMGAERLYWRNKTKRL